MPALLKSGGTYTFQQHHADFLAAVAQVTAGIAGFVAASILPDLPEFAGRDDPTVLDLGCGMGGTLLALARAYPKAELLGIDVEPRSVERANTRFAEAGVAQRVTARVAAAEGVDLAGRFDLVTLIQVLHETLPAVRADILASAARALKPGGVLLVVDEPYPETVEGLRAAVAAAAEGTDRGRRPACRCPVGAAAGAGQRDHRPPAAVGRHGGRSPSPTVRCRERSPSPAGGRG
jgi:SAM-dependent methyltransferase